MIIRYIGLLLVHFPLLTGQGRGSLLAAVESACRDLALERRIDRRHCGEPFFTEPGRPIEAVSDAVDLDDATTKAPEIRRTWSVSISCFLAL